MRAARARAVRRAVGGVEWCRVNRRPTSARAGSEAGQVGVARGEAHEQSESVNREVRRGTSALRLNMDDERRGARDAHMCTPPACLCARVYCRAPRRLHMRSFAHLLHNPRACVCVFVCVFVRACVRAPRANNRALWQWLCTVQQLHANTALGNYWTGHYASAELCSF